MIKPIGAYITCLLEECRHEKEILLAGQSYDYLTQAETRCSKCPKVLYGIRGFGVNLYDSICSCPNHKELAKYVNAQDMIDEAIENAVDYEIERKHNAE